MGMEMIKLQPGVNAELTQSLLQAGISTSSLIRFRAGLPEKLGGWEKYVQFAVGGVPKAMHAWLDFNENQYLTVGSTTILANISDGAIADLTPQTFTSDFAPNFSTVINTPTVTVTDANVSNVTRFDSIWVLTPISVGGLILQGVYPIDTPTGTHTYQITAAANAASTVNNAGAVPVFTTTANSSTVSVLLTGHGLSVGGEINLPVATEISTTGNDTYTKSLLHFDGADASTTITDSNAGGSAHTWTANGNAQLDTAQFKFGGASLLLDGTGDYVTTADSTDFTLGSSDWTIDFWFNCSAAGGSQQSMVGQCDSSATAASASFLIRRFTDNKIYASVCQGAGAVLLTSTSTFTTTGWHHVAFVRSGNTLYLFIDGVQEDSDTITGSVNNSSNALSIGRLGEENGFYFTGWIDEFRISNGIARWTTTFTPPTAEYGLQAIEILGTYSVLSVTDANNFTIAISQAPNSAGVFAMNGGLAEIIYYIAIGPTSSTGLGYGTGTYSSGTYSIGVPATSQQTGTPITAEDWTLDNWADTLLACPEGGGIYSWRPNTGIENAQLISQAPIQNTGMFVAQQVQMVIAYGAAANLDEIDQGGIGVDRDPLLVRWCNNGDFTAWRVSTTSQAGSRRLSTGSKIVGGLAVPQQELLWTDVGLWAMQYLGSLEAGVWGFTQIGFGCGLIGKHAHARLGAYIYWMSPANFYRLGASPEVIPCTVWDAVFQDLNEEHQHKCWAWADTPFNEVFFFYPRASTGATEPDAFVKLNVLEGTWDSEPRPGAPTTQMPRTCGIDQSILGKPISATPTGVIYQHETSPNADGAALVSSFTTGFFAVSDGLENMFVDWFLPDFKWADYPNTSGASIQVTLYSQFYPNGTVTTYGPYTVTASTPYFNPRLRGRLVSFKIESSDLDSFWRLGGCRARMQPKGRNP